MPMVRWRPCHYRAQHSSPLGLGSATSRRSDINMNEERGRDSHKRTVKGYTLGHTKPLYFSITTHLLAIVTVQLWYCPSNAS